jgi:hypothetical protein
MGSASGKSPAANSLVSRHTLARELISSASRNRPLRMTRLRSRWKPSVTPTSVTECSAPRTTTVAGISWVPAISTTSGMLVRTASRSASVISSLSAVTGSRSELDFTCSAYTTLAPTASICATMYRFPVRDALTTRTMLADPMTTPSVVSNVFTVLALKPVMAASQMARSMTLMEIDQGACRRRRTASRAFVESASSARAAWYSSRAALRFPCRSRMRPTHVCASA